MMDYKKAYTMLLTKSIIFERSRGKSISDDIKVAIDALEKQVTKKPRKSPFGNECFECGSVLDFGSVARFSFCPYCGQAIDWSDDGAEIH